MFIRMGWSVWTVESSGPLLHVQVEVADAAVRIFDIDEWESRLKLEYSGSASFEVVVIVD